MSLEEQLRAYASKGELVHLSVAFSNGQFHCNFAAASPAGGYASGVADDPVAAIDAAFKAFKDRPKRPRIAHPPVDTPEPEAETPETKTTPAIFSDLLK